MRKTTLSLMISALVVSGTAIAAEEMDITDESFEAGIAEDYEQASDVEVDAKLDDNLSIGDIRNQDPAIIFAELDVDANGEISEAEAEAMNGLSQQWFKIDVDGSGTLSMDEFSMLAENSSGIRGRGNNDFTRS